MKLNIVHNLLALKNSKSVGYQNTRFFNWRNTRKKKKGVDNFFKNISNLKYE